LFLKRSNLIKDTLPSLVNQYMQTCQQQLVQPRLSSFVSDHLEHIYNSIGKISTGVCPEVEKIGGEGATNFLKVCVKYRPKKNKLSEDREGGVPLAPPPCQ